MARHCKRFPVVASLLVLCCAFASEARAYEEQASFDLSLGYALLLRDAWPNRQGAGIDLGASIGIADTVVLRGSLGYAALGDGERSEHLGRLRAEGLYLLDVLKVVPFFGAGVTLTTAQHSDAQVPLRPGVHLLLGLDYLASRAWIFGLDLRSGILFEGGELLNATDVSLRMSRMFETF